MEGNQNNGWDPYHPNIAQDYSPQYPHLYSHQNNNGQGVYQGGHQEVHHRQQTPNPGSNYGGNYSMGYDTRVESTWASRPNDTNLAHAGYQPPVFPTAGHQPSGFPPASHQPPGSSHAGHQPPGNPPTGHQFRGVQLPSIQQPSYGTQPPGNPPNGHQFPGVQPPSFQQPAYSTQPSGVQPPGIQPPGVYSNQSPGVQQPAWGTQPPGVQQLAYGNQPYRYGYGQGPQSVISVCAAEQNPNIVLLMNEQQPLSSYGYDKDNDNSYDEPIRQARIRLDALNREINEAKVLETSSSLFDRHIPQGSRERQLLTDNDEINTFYKSALDVKGDR